MVLGGTAHTCLLPVAAVALPLSCRWLSSDPPRVTVGVCMAARPIREL